jgi:hypothetical protein
MGKKNNQSTVNFVRLVRQRPSILAIFAGMGLIVGCCCLVLVPHYDNKADKYFSFALESDA